VRSRVIHTTCFLCYSAPYSFGPVEVSEYWLMFRKRLAFSLPVLHSIFHLVLAMDWIDLFCADFIVMLGSMVFGMAAVFRGLVCLFISRDVLVSRYPFDVDDAGGCAFVDFVDHIPNFLDNVLSGLAFWCVDCSDCGLIIREDISFL
jgi:hypothetical protein